MATRRTPEQLLGDAAADQAKANMEMAKVCLKKRDYVGARNHLQKALTAVNDVPKTLFEASETKDAAARAVPRPDVQDGRPM